MRRFVCKRSRWCSRVSSQTSSAAAETIALAGLPRRSGRSEVLWCDDKKKKNLAWETGTQLYLSSRSPTDRCVEKPVKHNNTGWWGTCIRMSLSSVSTRRIFLRSHFNVAAVWAHFVNTSRILFLNFYFPHSKMPCIGVFPFSSLSAFTPPCSPTAKHVKLHISCFTCCSHVIPDLLSTISLPAPTPVSSISVSSPPEVHASKGDAVSLSCTFTSTSRPTSKMSVDWSYRPPSGGPPQTVSTPLLYIDRTVD